LEYLRSGPGRAFYAREQYWQPLPPGAPLPDDDLNPLATIDANEPAPPINSRRWSELQIDEWAKNQGVAK
jgi:hypothetical protein